MRHFESAGIIVYTLPSLYELRRAGHHAPDTITYLVLQYGHGHWDFVKGKLEPGETKQQAALRELQEETGITSIHLAPDFEKSFSYIYTEVDGIVTKKTVYFFLGNTQQTDVTLSYEHKDYAWLSFEKALEQLTFENARDLLRAAHRHIMI